MSILILLLIVIVVVALACYAVDLIPAPFQFGNLLKLLIIVIALVWLLNRSGLL